MVSHAQVPRFGIMISGTLMWILCFAPAFAEMPQADSPTVIEGFTITRYPMHGIPVTVSQLHPKPLKTTVYVVDGLEINESALSFKLSQDPKQSSLHGLRHAYAQERYEELTGWECPATGGPDSKSLTSEQRALGQEARLIVSQELGHERGQVTVAYLGR